MRCSQPTRRRPERLIDGTASLPSVASTFCVGRVKGFTFPVGDSLLHPPAGPRPGSRWTRTDSGSNVVRYVLPMVHWLWVDFAVEFYACHVHLKQTCLTCTETQAPASPNPGQHESGFTHRTGPSLGGAHRATRTRRAAAPTPHSLHVSTASPSPCSARQAEETGIDRGPGGREDSAPPVSTSLPSQENHSGSCATQKWVRLFGAECARTVPRWVWICLGLVISSGTFTSNSQQFGWRRVGPWRLLHASRPVGVTAHRVAASLRRLLRGSFPSPQLQTHSVMPALNSIRSALRPYTCPGSCFFTRDTAHTDLSVDAARDASGVTSASVRERKEGSCSVHCFLWERLLTQVLAEDTKSGKGPGNAVFLLVPGEQQPGEEAAQVGSLWLAARPSNLQLFSHGRLMLHWWGAGSK